MSFVLSSHNVFEYLAKQGLCTQEDKNLSKVDLLFGKNFNLLLNLPDDRYLLVKQERFDNKGKTQNELSREWRFQEFLQQFIELGHLRLWSPEAIYFDPNESIIVLNYLNDYKNLLDYYNDTNHFSPKIALIVGTVLATIHRTTFRHQQYENFLCQNTNNLINNPTKDFQNLLKIGPEVFGQIPNDGLKFLALYQQYKSLPQAIEELATTFESCCLTHNDLKLNNILINNEWEQNFSLVEEPGNDLVRFIDWERCSWGDPAFDIGKLIGCYIQIWLSSLVISTSLDIQESLRLAKTPLEHLQPSIHTLIKGYLNKFPEVLEYRPHFIKQVIQYSGLTLIDRIEATLQYQKSFGNHEICLLQVAKSLLCRPEESMKTIFGVL